MQCANIAEDVLTGGTGVVADDAAIIPSLLAMDRAGKVITTIGLALELAETKTKSKEREETKTLYHYTNKEGLSGILTTNQLNPSLKSENDKDARYGDGQYFSDIIPKTKTSNQLSRKFIGIPYKGDKYTNYLEIDVTGLNVIQARDGVYIHPSQEPLDLTGRIVSVGEN